MNLKKSEMNLPEVGQVHFFEGIEWQLKVDREAAARFGTDVLSIGSAVRLVTNGMVLATYRPEDVQDEVDIAVRVPADWRELDQLERQTLNSSRGQVPLFQFVDLEPGTKTGTIVWVDGQRTVADIVASLEQQFPATGSLGKDVSDFLQDARQQHWIELS